MSKKPIVLTIDNVRVIRFNEYNFSVERYEDVFIPTKKQTEKRWVFHGYASTRLKSLQLISRKELLVNKTSKTDLNDYVKKVEESNNKIINLKEID